MWPKNILQNMFSAIKRTDYFSRVPVVITINQILWEFLTSGPYLFCTSCNHNVIVVRIKDGTNWTILLLRSYTGRFCNSMHNLSKNKSNAHLVRAVQLRCKCH